MKSTNFTPQDLIHLFIDGEASDAQQKALFEELAASDNLQAEFQQALDIKKSMAADFESMTPPPAVEASLFARAGFDPPADPPASDPDPAPAPVAAAKPGWFTKIGMPLLAAAAGSLATLILMLSLGDEPQAAVQAQTAPAPVVESYAADTPKIEENSDRNDYIYKDNSGRNIASANAMNQRGNRASAVRENISGADNSGIINENPENIDQNIYDKEIHTIDASIYVPAAADGDLAAGFTGRDFSPANSV
ncbi:MAG: anti-sigma factor family protein, partial [Candidatus Kapaibacterium sp.]